MRGRGSPAARNGLGGAPPLYGRSTKSRIAYFPVVDRPAELRDLLSRAAWYLTSSPIEKIYILISEPALSGEEWRVQDGMDPKIAEQFGQLSELIEFVPARSNSAVQEVMEDVSVVLRWRKGAWPDWMTERDVARALAGKRLFEIDSTGERMEGANYIDVSYKLGPSTRELTVEQSAKFAAVLRDTGTFDRASLFATGPSVSEYRTFDFTDSLSVVCNTVILDEDLMETVQPRFAVFLDPIFHFGPSQYAADFRAALREVMASHRQLIVCLPLKYYPLFTAAMPDLADRTVAVPFEKERPFNFDLSTEFELRTTANVLTFAMIPLGTTFAPQIGILGCDGRPLDENTYFWRHNPATQLNERMQNIRQVHPAFFNVDYNDYYLEHCETLAAQLSAGERAGYRFDSLTPSHIPALKRRMTETTSNGHKADGHEGSALRSAGQLQPGRADRVERRCRLLVIDSTAVGSPTATGQLKDRFLLQWPADDFLQICAPRGGAYPVISGLRELSSSSRHSGEQLLEEVLGDYKPDVIYYRPTIDRHEQLHSLALDILDRWQVPLVTHIMDDWPARLRAQDPRRGAEVERSLRDLLGRSQRALSISDKMSRVLGARYGVRFEAFANGVDPDAFLEAARVVRPAGANSGEIVMRYCGALAHDMTFSTIVDVARAVDSLQGDVPLRFEVFTTGDWRRPFEQAIAGLSGTSTHEAVFGEGFPAVLTGADILVLGYNFDESSLRYIGLSMPNKLPEYLGSGTPILAVGPLEANGIEFVATRELAWTVTERDERLLVDAVRRLANDENLREQLGRQGQEWAFDNLNLRDVAARFRGMLLEAESSRPLLGPFAPEQAAWIDEGAVLEGLIGDRDHGVMLDIGAHQGSSIGHFVDAGWRVVACEPDPGNRKVLERRFGRKGAVTIDSRAVSDQPASGVAFFTSQESAGISTLHPFHETHRETATVDVTTVAALCDEHALTRVDFLKIDVEGLDWNVLKGVPWESLQPEVIECEFEDRKTLSLGYSYRDMAAALSERGYSVYLSEWHPIVRYGVRHRWHRLLRFPAELASADAWGNLLAFRVDPGHDVLRRAFERHLQVEAAAKAP
jgi:FkbM family methyltransferase